MADQLLLLHAPAHRSAAAVLRRAVRRLCPRRLRPGLALADEMAAADGRDVIALLSEELAAAVDRSGRDGIKPVALGLASGGLLWSGPDGRLEADASTALPRLWHSRFEAEPRWVDLRWLPAARRPRRDPRLLDAAAQLAAPLTGLTMEQLLRREARRVRNVRAAIAGGAVVVLLAAVAAATTTVSAAREREVAVAQAEAARARTLESSADLVVDRRPDTAFLLARQALGLDPALPQARGAAFRAVQALGTVEILARPDGREVRSTALRERDLLTLLAHADGTIDAVAQGRPPVRVVADAALTVPQIVATGDGGFVAVSGRGDVWRIAADLTVRRLPAPVGITAVTAVAWDEPDRQLLIGDASGHLHGWDLTTPGVQWTLPVGPAEVTAVASAGALARSGASATQGDLIAVADAMGWIALLRTAPDQPPSLAGRVPNAAAGLPVQLASPARALRFLTRGGTLASGGADGRVLLFDAGPLRQRPAPPAQAAGNRNGAVLSLAEVAGRIITTGVDGYVRIWDRTSGGHIGSEAVWGEPSAWAHAVPGTDDYLVVSSDGMVTRRPYNTPDGSQSIGIPFGDRVFVNGEERKGNVSGIHPVGNDGRAELSVRSAATSRPAGPTLPVTLRSSAAATLAADGRTVLVQLTAGTLTSWDGISGRVVAQTPVPGDASLNRLELSPRGDRLLGFTREGLVVWPMTGGTPGEPVFLPVVALSAGGVAFLQDGRVAVIGRENRELVLVDPASGAVTRPASDLADFSTLAASADRRRIVLAQRSGVLLVWDVAGRAVARRTDAVRATVTVMAFADDDGLIAAGTSDGDLWLVDAGSGTPIVGLRGHNYQVSRLAVLPDGRLLSSDVGGHSRVWDVRLDATLRRGCEVVSRPFTVREAAEFGVTAGHSPCAP